jgi:hypothetical protein
MSKLLERLLKLFFKNYKRKGLSVIIVVVYQDPTSGQAAGCNCKNSLRWIKMMHARRAIALSKHLERLLKLFFKDSKRKGLSAIIVVAY